GETIASIKDKEIENNLTSLTFNYLTSHDALGSIIMGASSVDQLDENVKNYELSKEISLEKLKAARNRVKNLEYTQHLK
ncbi:MAG: aldo/keto reductase, partial [Staphylococcus equorum]